MASLRRDRSTRPFSFLLLAALTSAAFACGGNPTHSSGSTGGSPTNTPPDTASFGSLDIALHVEEAAGIDRVSEPVRSGIPIPRELGLTDPSLLAVTDAAGHLVPSQIAVTSRWEGAPGDATKPIKWVLVDFQASANAHQDAGYRLRSLTSAAGTAGSLVSAESDADIVIDTGAAKFTVSKTHFDLLDGVSIGGSQVVSSDPQSGAFLVDASGARYTASATTEVSVEEDGPLHAVVVAKGKHTGPGGKLLDFTVREHFYKDRPDVLVQYAFTDRDLPHISSYDSLREIALTLPLSLGGGEKYTFGGDTGDVSGTLTGEAWQHESGKLDEAMGAYYNPGNADTIAYANGGAATGKGGKAPGWVDVTGANGGVTAAVKWYWQQYPKKLDVTANRLTVDLWPKEDVTCRVYAAAQKSHEVLLSFHGPQQSATDLGHMLAARLAEPLFARANPSWYAKSRVWNRIGTADGSDYTADNQAVVDAYFKNLHDVEFPQTFVERRYDAAGKGHEYSMWDFGDDRGEAWEMEAYDTPRTLLIHYALTGDRDYFDRGLETATHERDVDIEHSPQDTRAGIYPSRGVTAPWLGRSRYTPAKGAQSHDLGYQGATTYGFEHHKGQGLSDHYFLTGDRLSRDVLEEAYHYYEQWKVDADNGYLRTDGTRVVSHMLLVLIGYYDAFGTDEARQRIDFTVNYLNDWQRRKTAADPNGWMWMTINDSTANFMNGVTAESLMLYEQDFPDGIPVKQNIVDAAKWTVDPKNGALATGPNGHYFNAWSNDNYGINHATVLDPMMVPLLGYAFGATGDTSYRDLGKEVLLNCIHQDASTPFMKSFTQQTRLVPAFLWFLETPDAQAPVATQAGS